LTASINFSFSLFSGFFSASLAGAASKALLAIGAVGVGIA